MKETFDRIKMFIGLILLFGTLSATSCGVCVNQEGFWEGFGGIMFCVFLIPLIFSICGAGIFSEKYMDEIQSKKINQ